MQYMPYFYEHVADRRCWTLKISNEPAGHGIKYQENALSLLCLFHSFPDRMAKTSQGDLGNFINGLLL